MYLFNDRHEVKTKAREGWEGWEEVARAPLPRFPPGTQKSIGKSARNCHSHNWVK